jgi:hypothetical protein
MDHATKLKKQRKDQQLEIEKLKEQRGHFPSHEPIPSASPDDTSQEGCSTTTTPFEPLSGAEQRLLKAHHQRTLQLLPPGQQHQHAFVDPSTISNMKSRNLHGVEHKQEFGRPQLSDKASQQLQ